MRSLARLPVVLVVALAFSRSSGFSGGGGGGGGW